MTRDNRPLRSSTFFIKEGSKLVGKLGISVASLYRYLSMIAREKSLEGTASAT